MAQAQQKQKEKELQEHIDRVNEEYGKPNAPVLVRDSDKEKVYASNYTPPQAKQDAPQQPQDNSEGNSSPKQNSAVQSGTEGKKNVNNTSLDNSEKSDKIKEVGIDNVTGENATIDERKFTEYALNPEKQPDKARAFEMALGYNLKNYESLKKQIREGFKRDNLIGKGSNAQGNKYEMLYEIYGLNGKTAKVLTAWLDDIYDQKDFHLTSLYVDE